MKLFVSLAAQKVDLQDKSTLLTLLKLAKSVRNELKVGKYSNGTCAIVSYTIWERLGKPPNLVPTSVMVGEEEHVVLRDAKLKTSFDATADQFDGKIGLYGDYDNFYDTNSRGNLDLEKITKVALAAIENERDAYKAKHTSVLNKPS